MTEPVRPVFEPVIEASAAAELGERPIWDDETNEVVWVDIAQGIIHRQTPGAADRPIRLDTTVGAVGLRTGGGYVAAAGTCFLLLDADGELTQPPIPLPGLTASVSFNDGAVDAAGRFWAGTSSTIGQPAAAALYCLEPDGAVRTVMTGVTESNGLAWSPEGSTLYYVDSGLPEVGAWDFDPVSGEPGNRRTFARFTELEGIPDGLTADASGNLWVALWGGGVVLCYSAGGRLICRIEFPVSRVTCAGFGGETLTDLYVTTAWEGASAAERAEQPAAGHLFRVNSAGRGLPTNRFRG